MSKIIARFDPSANPTGTFALSNLSSGIGTIVIWNESNWTLDVEFPNGDIDLAPAWTASIFNCNGPQGSVTWIQDTQLISNNPPLSKAWVVAYGQNENIPGTYPLALVRQTTLGNSIAVATAADSIQNTGMIAGTNTYLAQVIGDANSSTMTNDSQWNIGTAANPGDYQFANGLFHLASTGVLSAGDTSGTHEGMLNLSMKGVSINGASSGTATMYQFMTGTVKAFIIYWTNFNTGGATQNITLPTAFTVEGHFWTGETGGGTVTFLSSGTPRVCSVQDTTSVNGGTSGPQTHPAQWSHGQTRGSFDTIQLDSFAASTGQMFCIGL